MDTTASGPGPASRPFVSVVVPAFDAEPYLADAIESVLAQTYSPLECIVVDDGSRDGTREVAERYGERVRLVSQGNQGVAAARNAGIEAARGELVAFLDADDVWLPDKLERQVPAFALGPELVMSYGGIEPVDADLQPLGHAIAAHPAEEAVRRTLTLRPGGFHVAMTGVLRRRTLLEIGGFDPRLSTSADADLALRALDLGVAMPAVGILARYRQHPRQMHRDLATFESDWKVVLGRALASRPQMRGPARAELSWTLAASNWRAGRRRLALRQGASSMRHPPTVIRRVAERHGG